MFRTEIKRLFSASYIIKSLLFMIALLSLGVMTFFYQYGTNENTLYKVFENIIFGGYFFELIYIPASFFQTLNLSMDIQQKSYYLYSSRSSKMSYIFAKISIGSVFAFVITELVLNIMILVGAFNLNLIDMEYMTGGADIYEDVIRNNIWIYFEMRIFFVSLSSGVFNAIGMLVTALIPSKYVAVSSAYIFSIILQKIGLIMRIPIYTSISNMAAGLVRINKSVVISVGYITMFSLVCITVTACLFERIMMRRCFDEKK